MKRVTRTLTTLTLGLTLATAAAADSGMYRMPDGRLLLTNFLRTDGVPVGETARRLAPAPERTSDEPAIATPALATPLTPDQVQVAAAAYVPAPTPPPAPATPRPQEAKVEMVDWRPRREYGWYYIEGILKNVGMTPARRVQLKAIAFDADGHFVALQDGYADPTDIGPEQQATFRIMMRHDARIDKFDVSWRWQ